MTDHLDEVLKHRYIYVPRGKEKNTVELGKRLGLATAREHRATMAAPHVPGSAIVPATEPFAARWIHGGESSAP